VHLLPRNRSYFDEDVIFCAADSFLTTQMADASSWNSPSGDYPYSLAANGLVKIPGTLAFVLLVAPIVAAATLSFLNALQFGTGEKARLAWIVIAIMPIADLLVFTSFGLAGKVSVTTGEVLVVFSTALTSLSRILAVIALYMMVQVYKKSGMVLPLTRPDYAMMALVGTIGVICVVFSGSWAG
jgi:hypothetical protein